MEKELLKTIVLDLAGAIKLSRGLEVYAEGNNSFEQWMQITVCGTLKTEGAENIEVETSCGGISPDICFKYNGERYAIELKFVIAEGGGGRSQLSKILPDIDKLNTYKEGHGIDNGIILFAIFPFRDGKDIDLWANETKERKEYYGIIKKRLEPIINPHQFIFSNGVKGYVFSGILRGEPGV